MLLLSFWSFVILLIIADIINKRLPVQNEYDYLINVDNDSIYITSPGENTYHYEISWDDSLSIKDIILIDNK